MKNDHTIIIRKVGSSDSGEYEIQVDNETLAGVYSIDEVMAIISGGESE